MRSHHTFCGLLPLALVFMTACGGGAPGVTEQPAVPPLPTMDDVTAAALADTYTITKLEELCDTVGSRLAGSEGMTRAIAWSVRSMEEAGFDSVWTEPVTVPHWTRGFEWARMTYPVEDELEMLGLGLSDGTGPGGIEAEVLAVSDFDELEVRSDEVQGKIVLFDMAWEGYGKSVQYRVHGASRAAKYGAVACLIRSVTSAAQGPPHTGMMRYDDETPRIPIAALTVEDAGRLHRLADRGLRPRVHLYMEAVNHGETTCFNVVGDVRGRELPDELVLVSGHLDSWDVGPSAQDDGAGVTLALGTGQLLVQPGLRPRRTVRVVHYTCEEYGGAGGLAYRDAHRDEIERHVLALESDSGAFEPRGLSVQADSVTVERLAQLAEPLSNLAPDHWKVSEGGSGVDIRYLADDGVPCVGHRVDGSRYFDVHHSRADTFEKINPQLVARNLAVIAGFIFAVADSPDLPERSKP